MKKIFLILILLVILLPSACAQSVTIHGADFEIPSMYEHGTAKESSYVYESGHTFRILGLENKDNLRINYGDDIVNAKSSEQTSIAGHDAIVIHDDYKGKEYTTIYLPIGNEIFLICYNDTYVRDDIQEMISKAPAQTMSTEDFLTALNSAVDDYQNQVSQEQAELDAEAYQRANKPTNRYYFFWF